MWLGKRDLTDGHLVRAQLVRREPSISRRDSTEAKVEVHEHDNENEEKKEDDNKDEKPPDKPDDDDHDMQGEMLPEPDTTSTTPGTSSTSRGEKRTETQGNVFVKKRLTMKSPKRPVTPVPPPEDPVKRRLMKKSQRKDNLVMNVVADLLNTVNTLLSDETVPETNPCEDSEPPNMLTILGDPTEKMKRRQTELNSLKEMGVMTAVKRTTTAGKRVIQTRWVDLEKDGCVKSRLVLKDINHDHGRMRSVVFHRLHRHCLWKQCWPRVHMTERCKEYIS